MPGNIADTPVSEKESITELRGKLSFQSLDDKLMHLILENDKDSVEKGKTIQEALDAGIGALTVDLMMETLVRNYSWAQKMFGERLLRLITGYDPTYIESNIRIPEFQRELKSAIGKRIEALKKEGLLEKDGSVTEKGIELSSLMLFIEELGHLRATTYGERHDQRALQEEKQPYSKPYKHERFRDISLKKTVRAAVQRGRKNIQRQDLRVQETKKKGELFIVYAIDASGSMKGDKIRNAKKAGIALAYKAIQEKNKVGLLIFSKRTKNEVACTDSFISILKALAAIKAKEETDIAQAINSAANLFPKTNASKHLILLTDSLPTIGEKPVEETLHEVSAAKAAGITISVIGLSLTEEGRKLSEKIVELGDGRLYMIRDIEKLDTIILEDYELI